MIEREGVSRQVAIVKLLAWMIKNGRISRLDLRTEVLRGWRFVERVKPIAPPERERDFCRCGVCRSCDSDVRWNRIYEEKFADPAYYSRLPERARGSALADL